MPVDISNTASAPVLVGIAIILGALGKIIVELYGIKHKAADAKQASEKAVENTENVANGFARTMGGKLDQLIAQQSSMEAGLRDHLQWHIEHSDKES